MKTLEFLVISILAGSTASSAGERHSVPRLPIQMAAYGLDETPVVAKTDVSDKKPNVSHLVSNTVFLINALGGYGGGVLLSDSSTKEILGRHYASFRNRAFILTTFHAVAYGVENTVFFAPKEHHEMDSGTGTSVEIVATMPEKDLALLISNEKPDYLSGVDVDFSLSEITLGSQVDAVGHPARAMWTYSHGYVSQVRENYNWRTSQFGIEHKAKVIQTQTPISPGNSGGPLFSSSGELIGINCFQNREDQNVNFAIAASEFSLFSQAIDETNVRLGRRLEIMREDFSILLADYAVEQQAEGHVGAPMTVYEHKSNGELIVAVFPSGDYPYFYRADPTSGAERLLSFHIDHVNPSAVFRVQVKDLIDERVVNVAEGWDFDGDFKIDYVIELPGQNE